MKIEKLTKDNIEQFIRNIGIENTENLVKNVDKSNLYGLKSDDVFCLGFDSSADVDDSIGIVFYSSKLSDKKFLDAIDFLSQNVVVNNHLVVSVYNSKHMKLLDSLYNCKEVIFSLKINDNGGINSSMREKYADIDMKSIRYLSSKDEVTCNLVKQNIQDEKTILALHEYFKSLNTSIINFIAFDESSDYLSSLGYDCFCKSYVIKK